MEVSSVHRRRELLSSIQLKQQALARDYQQQQEREQEERDEEKPSESKSPSKLTHPQHAAHKTSSLPYFHHKASANVEDVHAGRFDREVPCLVLTVDSIAHTPQHSAILHLSDSTGKIIAYIEAEELEELQHMVRPRTFDLSLSSHSPLASDLQPGCVLHLSNTALFISRTNLCRYLQIKATNMHHILPPNHHS